MSQVRAKFACVKAEKAYDSGHVDLEPVIDGSPENESFYKWTPGGRIQLSVVNDAAFERFEVGKEYYVDFTRAS